MRIWLRHKTGLRSIQRNTRRSVMNWRAACAIHPRLNSPGTDRLASGFSVQNLSVKLEVDSYVRDPKVLNLPDNKPFANHKVRYLLFFLWGSLSACCPSLCKMQWFLLKSMQRYTVLVLLLFGPLLFPSGIIVCLYPDLCIPQIHASYPESYRGLRVVSVNR